MEKKYERQFKIIEKKFNKINRNAKKGYIRLDIEGRTKEKKEELFTPFQTKLIKCAYNIFLICFIFFILFLLNKHLKTKKFTQNDHFHRARLKTNLFNKSQSTVNNNKTYF